jgi:CHASE3 domain sensor protein
VGLTRTDREEIFGLSRAAAVEVYSDAVKEIFERVNADRDRAEKKIDSIAEDITEIKVAVAKMPQRTHEAIEQCQAKQQKSRQWVTTTVIAIVSSLIAIGSLVVSFASLSRGETANQGKPSGGHPSSSNQAEASPRRLSRSTPASTR